MLSLKLFHADSAPWSTRRDLESVPMGFNLPSQILCLNCLFSGNAEPSNTSQCCGAATAARLICPASVCALYAQIRWDENTKVNSGLSNAADQNRQNILLVGSNRWLHSYCQLGRPCALRFLGELRRRLISPRRKMDVFTRKRSNPERALFLTQCIAPR